MKSQIKPKFVSPLLMWFIVIIGILIIMGFAPNYKIFSLGIFGSLIIIAVLAYWLYFFINSIFVHRKAAMSVYKIDRIIKTGAYKIVRHPIYSSDIILAWGIFFFIPSYNVLISVVWLTLVLLFWMKLEEKYLVKKFGKEYESYKMQTPMIIPGLKWKF